MTSSAPVIPISILMSTYAGERAPRLAASLESIFTQTLLPAQLVLVIDGPVDEDQQGVIKAYANRSSSITFTQLQLKECGGLAAAMNKGLSLCSEVLVARMDSDDIMFPQRLEKQYAYLLIHPDVDVLTTWTAEFEDDLPQFIVSIKQTPSTHESIVRSLRWRCSIGHPTIIFRKAMAESIGGYDETVGFLEDHDFHIRMIHAGATYATLQEPLVKFRISRSQRLRRGGLKYIGKEWLIRYRCFRRGDIPFSIFVAASTAKTIFCLQPPFVKKLLYRFVRSSTS